MEAKNFLDKTDNFCFNADKSQAITANSRQNPCKKLMDLQVEMQFILKTCYFSQKLVVINKKFLSNTKHLWRLTSNKVLCFSLKLLKWFKRLYPYLFSPIYGDQNKLFNSFLKAQGEVKIHMEMVRFYCTELFVDHRRRN